jgi:hypothetical protein
MMYFIIAASKSWLGSAPRLFLCSTFTTNETP